LTYLSLFSIRHLPPVLAATILSRLAGRMLSLTLILYALARFGSPTLAGWLIFALIFPGLIISPLAGALLDRLGPSIAIAVDMAASALLLAALVAADRMGLATPITLFVLISLVSLTSPLTTAGIRTLLPSLVPREALDRVNALDTAIHAVVDIIGPGLAGLMAAFIGTQAALAAIAAVYAIAALCMARIRRLSSRRPATASLLHQAIGAIALVAREPTLRGLAIAYSLYQVTWGVLVVVVPVVTARHLAPGQADSVTGFIWAAMGVAGGAGALLAGHFRTTGRERGVMALGMLVTALAAFPVAALGLPGLILALLLGGAVAGPVDVGLLTLRQRRTHPAQLGRVLSVSISLNLAGFPLGSALAGMLIATSLPATLLLAGAASALAALATLAIPRETVSA
jgi:MFS family permease